MAVRANCPSSHELHQALTGELPPDRVAVIEQHLLECEPCAQQTLCGGELDTYMHALRERPRTSEGASAEDTQRVEQLISKLQHLPQQNDVTQISNSDDEPESDLEADLRTYLQPAKAPGEIGWLGGYRVLKVLGIGGMGAVFLAEDTQLHRRVALKVMRPEVSGRSNGVERFLREARAAAALRHDHIITIYQVGKEGKIPFLAMEFLEGESLEDRQRREPPLTIPEVLRIGREVADGLAVAHARGLVHRDIKPANIWLETRENSTPRVKLLDFGLARSAEEDSGLTSQGMIIGTPAYMAPEQAGGDVVDHRADLFSLGVVLYRLATGELPFKGRDTIATLVAVRSETPRSPVALRGDLPQSLSDLIDRLLIKDPGQRLASAADVARQLGQIESHPDTPNRAKSSSGSGAKQPRSPGGIIAISAAAAFLILGLLGAVIVLSTDQGKIIIESEVADVDVSILKGGQEVAVIDTQTGSTVKWLPSGQYEVALKGNRNDIEISDKGFTLSRWGKKILRLQRKQPASDLATDWSQGKLHVATLQKFDPGSATISQDGITTVDDGWKIDAQQPRTAQLFEVDKPDVEESVVLFRAKLKTENVIGKAYLEMWLRTPGSGESFSKGLQTAATGTTGWSSHEIPFIVQKGQRIDLIKLHVNVEGTGTVWIKDLELARASTRSVPAAATVAAKDNGKPQIVALPRVQSNVAPPPARAPFNAEQAKQYQAGWAKFLEVPVEYTNSIGMKFVLIPPGEFLMGSPPAEVEEALNFTRGQGFWQECILGEAPRHTVILTRPLYIGIHEVTQAQYQLVMGQNPSEFAATGRLKDAVAGRNTADHPVEMASWNDAAAFCVKLSQAENLKAFYTETGEIVNSPTGSGYRLPTDAEWEFACRAGTTTKFWIGRQFEDLARAGWSRSNSNQRTHAVGELAANPFGLFDVHGNVSELVQDWWDPRYYGQFANVTGFDPSGPKTNDQAIPRRVVRSGSFDYESFACRAAFRNAAGPNDHNANVGFRVALPVDTVRKTTTVTSAIERRRLTGHQGPVHSVVFSTDGKRALSGSGYPDGDGTMRLWEVETGKEIRQFSDGGMSWVMGVALSPDGKLAVSTSYDGLRLWDVETGQVLHRLNTDAPAKAAQSAVFLPDGKRFISCGDDQLVRIWDVASGTQIRTFERHNTRVTSVAISPDGSRLVSSGFDHENNVFLWNVETGEQIHQFVGQSHNVERVAFSNDGSRILIAANDGLRLWDAKTFQLIRYMPVAETDVLTAAFFPDGRRVISGSKSGQIVIWDSETGQVLGRLTKHPEWVWTVAVSPDGKQALIGGGGGLINGSWTRGQDWAIRLWQLPMPDWEPEQSNAKWEPLFNGQNLDGWEMLWPEFNNWKVENGILIGRSPPNQLLSKRKDFGDFHLRAEARLNATGNSGIFFRVQESQGVPRLGYEMEFGFGEAQKSGSLMHYGVGGGNLHSETRERVQPDSWQILEIIATGNGLTTKINGDVVTNIAHAGYQKGRIELQVFGGQTTVEFRKIEIKEFSKPESVKKE